MNQYIRERKTNRERKSSDSILDPPLQKRRVVFKWMVGEVGLLVELDFFAQRPWEGEEVCG